jgi:oxygen-independent coproporphyrinogen-3 oxidase
MVGAGVSAIGDLHGAFAQNVKKLSSYYDALDAGRFPIERGYALSADDLLRRHVITELMCNFFVDRAETSRRFGVAFDAYFERELSAVAAPGGPVEHGFLRLAENALEVTDRGRLFVRNICMQFDKYLPAHDGRPVFSRTI